MGVNLCQLCLTFFLFFRTCLPLSSSAYVLFWLDPCGFCHLFRAASGLKPSQLGLDAASTPRSCLFPSGRRVQQVLMQGSRRCMASRCRSPPDSDARVGRTASSNDMFEVLRTPRRSAWRSTAYMIAITDWKLGPCFAVTSN